MKIIMIKKDYQRPTMQVVALNVNAQILTGSVTDVITNLDDPITIPTDDDTGDIIDAMAREDFQFDEEEEW